MGLGNKLVKAGLIACCLLALAQMATAQTAQAQTATDQTALADQAAKTPAAQVPTVTTYKQNFFLHTKDSRVHPDGRETEEAKLQFSMKYQLIQDQPYYFGYTQKSFWQIYDHDRSRPFRENNFNPEFFFDGSNDTGNFAMQIGIEHESNGRGFEFDEAENENVNKSRSWNRVYVQPKLKFGKDFVTSLKLWYRLEEDAKLDDNDPGGDDNPDIQQYLGYLEWRTAWVLRGKDDIQLLSMIRDGRISGTGTIQLDLLIRPYGSSRDIFIQFHFFKGYGESLIDYNREVTKVGIGFAAGNPFDTAFPK